jgi:glyoxylase-like metal-dependent hydrolase (beta-lactamase superfamily II)
MKPVEIGRVRVENVIEFCGPTRRNWLFPDTPREAMERHRWWLAPHFLDDWGRLIMSIHAFVVRAPGLTVVVDTCIGNDKPRANPGWNMLQGSFLADLETIGVSPESVDLVLCTHLHVDHVGWNTRLVDGRWLPTFPRARYLIGRREWEHWSGVAEGETPVIMADSVRPVFDAGLVDLVEMDHVISPELELEPTPGHTPGHVSLRITSGGDEVVISGDLMHHPVQCAEPAWLNAFDVDRDAACATRRAFCARSAASQRLVLGTHFAPPTVGRIVPHEGAWRFQV